MSVGPAENQFGVNSSYHYGVVDLPDGPNMGQTHVNIGRPGYFFDELLVSTQRGDTLSKSGSPTLQPLKIFQFIIGKLRVYICSFADESDNVCSFVFSDNSTSDTSTPTISTGAPPPTVTPHTVTTLTGDISSLPSTLTTPTSNTDVTFSNPTSPSPSASSTVSPATG